jgi:hypothetical protein
MVQLGLGHHVAELAQDPANFTSIRFQFWITEFCYKIALQTTKLSLLLLYKRIFGTVQWFKLLMNCSIVFIFGYIVATVLASIFACTPVAAAYDSRVHGTCMDMLPFFLFNAYFATISDIIVLIMPLPLLVGLKISLGQKLALIPVFGLGVVVVTFSGIRLASFYAPFSPDSAFFELTGPMWTVIEVNLAVLCAALPSVRILLARLFPKYIGIGHSRPRTAHSSHPKTWNSNAWSRIDGENGVQLTSVSNHVSTSSKDLYTRTPPRDGIQKTVVLKVEYGA